MRKENKKETNEFDVLLKVVEVLEKKISLDHKHITEQHKKEIKIGIEKIELAITKNHMGDKINIKSSQIGSLGSNSTSENNIFNQIISEDANLDYEKLATQISKLKAELIHTAKSPTDYKAVSEIAYAEEAIKKRDNTGILKHLFEAGSWAFEKAKEIGADIVTELIKKQMGL